MEQWFIVHNFLLEWQKNNTVFYLSYKLFLIALLFLCAISLFYIAGKNASEQQKWLLLTLMGFVTTLIFYFGEVTATNIDTMLLVVKAWHITKVLSTLCFLKYSSIYCKVKVSNKWMDAYYCYIVWISANILFADKIPFFYKSYTMKYYQGMPCFSATYGFIFYLYSFSLCAAIFVVLFMIAKRMTKVNVLGRKRLSFLFFTGLLPVIGYVLTMALPFWMIDLVPVSFGISALLLYIASKQHGLLDVVLSAKENIIENTKEGIVVVDNEYNVLYANQSASDLIDHVFDYKTGKELEEFISLFQEEKNIRQMKGRMYEISVSDIYENTKVRGKMAWLFDVTEAQEYTREILHLKDEAERANLAKSAFLANMSHEIRTPMNAILGFSELVIQQEKQETIKDYMYDIKHSAESLLHIINQILDISKIESGMIEAVEEEFNLQAMLEDVMTIISSEANKKGLKYSTYLPEQLPSAFYGADVQLREILINILNNAVKYTREGEVTLTVSCEDANADVTPIYFEVKDTGIGMKEEDINRIYDRFRKFDSMNNQGIEGNGLGMYIVKSLVTRLNGTIEIDSTYGKGTTIKITIPFIILDHTPMEKWNNSRQEQVKNHKKMLVDARILVVDDNEVNLKLISGLLLRYGIHPDLAVSGEKAIEYLRTQSYDLVYVDHMMPEMDGVQTMQRIREMEDGAYKELPIILLTANAIAGFREEMLSAGFQDYISKPIDIEYLEKTLVEYLPKESITYVEEEMEEDTCDATLELIDGIQSVLKHLQVMEGIQNCGGNYADYVEVLKITEKHGQERVKKLRELYQEENYENYTIDVHALKSTAYNIGARELGDEAKAQEYAGKSGNFELIRERFEFLLEEYQIVLFEIRKWLYLMSAEQSPNTKDSKNEVISDQERNEILDGVKKQVEEFEFDKAQNILQELLTVIEEDNIKEQIKRIMEALDTYDIEGAKELLSACTVE